MVKQKKPTRSQRRAYFAQHQREKNKRRVENDHFNRHYEHQMFLLALKEKQHKHEKAQIISIACYFLGLLLACFICFLSFIYR